MTSPCTAVSIALTLKSGWLFDTLAVFSMAYRFWLVRQAHRYARCFIKGTLFLSYITQSNDDQFLV